MLLFTILTSFLYYWGRYNYGFYSLFKKYLSDKIEINMEDKSRTINVNAVSFTGPNCEPETVLDYMYREINRLDISPERKIRVNHTIFKALNDFKEKVFAPLSPEVQVK
jgi:hypothetical protein